MPEQSPSLRVVEPSAEPPTLNVFLYGPPKQGKSVGAASAPGPVLYLNCESPNALRFAHRLHDDLREVRVTGLADLNATVLRLRDGKAGDRSVVVDPVGDLHRLLLEEASSRAIRPALQAYGDVSVHVERFCRALCELPVNAVFVAHEQPLKDEESGGFERLPWTGTTNPALGAKIMAMVDVIGYCGVRREEGKDPAYVAQLVDGAGRRGGDRTGTLGASRELDLAEWVRTAAAPPKNKKAA
jgi:hypothetical protein